MFLINLQGKESIYEQIKSQIEKFIKIGILRPDDKLPSVRGLASELGINPNTVMKAYQQLEAEGYIYTLNKKGVFVCGNDDEKKLNRKVQALHMLQSLKEMGSSKQEILEYVNEVFDNAEDQ